jgi:hypothetical protein
MKEGSEGSEGSKDADESEVSGVADEVDVADDSDPVSGSESGSEVSESDSETDPETDSDPDSDAWDSSEDSGWFADPDVEGQERYFDGSDWTPETRPTDLGVPVHHLPDHAGELQRALAAATNDIDEVEDRLGSLFDRAQQHGERGGRAAARKQADETAGRAAEGRALAESLNQGDDGPSSENGVAPGLDALDGDDDDALADLDEALATEEPEKVKKSFFRRRS